MDIKAGSFTDPIPPPPPHFPGYIQANEHGVHQDQYALMDNHGGQEHIHLGPPTLYTPVHEWVSQVNDNQLGQPEEEGVYAPVHNYSPRTPGSTCIVLEAMSDRIKAIPTGLKNTQEGSRSSPKKSPKKAQGSPGGIRDRGPR